MDSDSEWVDFLVPVEIIREGTQAAWGFRLRGGSDVEGGTPLEIIKVTCIITTVVLTFESKCLFSVKN